MENYQAFLMFNLLFHHPLLIPSFFINFQKSFLILNYTEMADALGEAPQAGSEKRASVSLNFPKLKEIVGELEKPQNSKHRTKLEKDYEKAKDLLNGFKSMDWRENIGAMRAIRQIRKPTKPVEDVTAAFLLLQGVYEGYSRVGASCSLF